jgi:hypothetical protein
MMREWKEQKDLMIQQKYIFVKLMPETNNYNVFMLV